MSQIRSGPVDADEADSASPYVTFSADDWAALRASTPLSLSEADLDALRGLNVSLSLAEVVRFFLPLSRLLNLHVRASQELYRATDTFLGKLPAKTPFVIGVAGSVAVGKSTTSRVLRQVLARWPNHPRVELVTTDGFLYPNRVLQERGLMDRKGFPESYDRRRLLSFLDAVKSGSPRVDAPVYSHLVYDVEPESVTTVEQPDILIVEGLNVLQTGPVDSVTPTFVSDYFDFSVYVDAPTPYIRQWYVERFLTLRETAFQDPRSYFRRYGDLSDDEAVDTATDIWTRINERNLVENILPTRYRADLVMVKGSDHTVDKVLLRRL